MNLSFFAKFWLNLTACWLLAACDKPLPERPSLTEVPKYELKRALYGENASAGFQFDPHFVRAETDAAPLRDLLLGLMAFDRQGNPIPAIAREWFSEDGKQWLFLLDENARWSNGEIVTAADFVASWQRLIAPENGSPLARYLSYMGVANANAILRGEKAATELGVEALNPHSLKIQLEQANFLLPKMLAHVSLLPTYQGIAPSSSLISNGAYRLIEHQPNRLKLAGSPDLAFPIVYYDLLANRETGYDIIENPAHDAAELYTLPRLCHYFYEFNFNDPLLSQKPVRQAIRAMLPPLEISRGFGIPSYFAVPPSLLSVNNQAVVMATPEQFISPNSPLVFRLSYDLAGNHPQIAANILRALGQSDLFRTERQPMSWEALLQQREQKQFQLARGGWCADFPDPVAFLQPFHSRSPDNKSGYSNADVDGVLEQLQQQPLENSERERLIRHILSILEEDVALLPLFQYQRRLVVHPSVQGIDLRNSSEVIYSKDLSRYSLDKESQ